MTICIISRFSFKTEVIIAKTRRKTDISKSTNFLTFFYSEQDWFSVRRYCEQTCDKSTNFLASYLRLIITKTTRRTDTLRWSTNFLTLHSERGWFSLRCHVEQTFDNLQINCLSFHSEQDCRWDTTANRHMTTCKLRPFLFRTGLIRAETRSKRLRCTIYTFSQFWSRTGLILAETTLWTGLCQTKNALCFFNSYSEQDCLSLRRHGEQSHDNLQIVSVFAQNRTKSCWDTMTNGPTTIYKLFRTWLIFAETTRRTNALRQSASSHTFHSGRD